MKKIKSKDLIIEIAIYFIVENSTIRKTAKKFNLSKSTIHIYLQKDLKRMDFELYSLTRKIVKQNWEEMSARGIKAIRLKRAS